MKYRQFTIIFIGLVTILLLTCLTPWVATNRVSTDQWNPLNPGIPSGFIFVARYSDLQAIHYVLKQQPSGGINLTAHLRSNPASMTDVYIEQKPGCDYFRLTTVSSNRISFERSNRLINYHDLVKIFD